ncbi:transglycosylase domain-containing protein [Candidatus Dojkabacteria bacterium]|nr:transglycosylase domain-containing protein [Candidatus Dojkabacteria bacterium]
MAYKTAINYNRRRTYKSRFQKRLKKLKSKRGKKGWSKSVLGKDSLKGRVKKVLGIFAGIVFVVIFITTIFTLSVIAKYSSELPNPDEPFERGQDLTSYVYDRNGKELYKIHGDENRDIVQIDEVPLEAQWAFLAAEDIDFYTHKGVDLGGVVKAGMYEVFKVGSPRGGSTITQQMIKNTVLTTERTYERKIKEIILSLRIEQKYDKKDVLQLYLNEIGFGGNTYGVKTAARIYFGKDVTELSLGEAALLAGLPQAPGLYSPLFASDVKVARELAIQRQNYVLDQLQSKKDKINAYARKYNGWEGEEDLITDEKIQQAREQKIAYKTSDINIEAPHFVFYVEDELTKGNYNNGRPFTLSEVERGGLRITTSLDLDMQNIAEESILNGVENVVKAHGGNNAALVTIDPKTGQVLAMVGSADYFGTASPEGCTLGADCKFEPNVNVAVALRQPGSSLKPVVYYAGFETGQLYPAYPFLDMDVPFDGNYRPKNNDGRYHGLLTLRQALRDSLNIPAVEAIEIVGVTNFINTLEKFGYSTFTNPENYGDAIALGAGDVKLVEHTNAYAVMATGGIYHPISPILKIEDKEGNVIYDFNTDEVRQGVRVADERAVYLVNDTARNYHYTPPAGWDQAGKTGTNDNNTNVWYMGWTPEVVTGVWAGNNDNSRMNKSAYGYTAARPIWIDYTNKILPRFTPSRFTRPGGVVSASVCRDSGLLATEHCEAISDLFIQDKLPPQDDSATQLFRVCSDQQDRLARDIDEQLGLVIEKVYRYIKAPKDTWQAAWDSYFSQGAPPTEYCDINRNPTGEDNPWVTISKPAANTAVSKGGKVDVEARAYATSSGISKIEVYVDGTYITQATNNPFVASVTIPATVSDGWHDLIVKAYDGAGRTGSASVRIIVGDVVSITDPQNGVSLEMAAITVTAQRYGGTSVTSARLLITGPGGSLPSETMSDSGGGAYTCTWAPTQVGSYTLQAALTLSNGSTIYSQNITINVVSP